jgi:hypothetical protein
MDNPNYIEEQMVAINKELKEENPDTSYLREKIEKMERWTHEIDLAEKRAKEKQ